jgi:prepilin-type N-terminal cleavage/methylation domain-containing protein
VRPARRNDKGFTLIEMMITVAILGILSAIAIPNFQRYQARSRRAEAYANLASIAKTEKAYYAEYSSYVEAAPEPGGAPPSPTKRPWTAAAEAVYAAVGWRPEGDVFYDYEVNSTTGGGCPALDCFTASAFGDADGNGQIAIISYAQPNAAGVVALDSLYGFPLPIDPVTGNTLYNAVAVNTGAADLY